MSTTTTTQSTAADRSFIDRLRASKFLTELFANRLAVFGLSLIVAMVLIAIYARLTYDLSSLTATKLSTNPTGQSPNAEFWFGTDTRGRDIFPRVLYGAWFALKYGTVAVLASTVLGIAAGTVAAYYGDITDNVIMRSMDIL